MLRLLTALFILSLSDLCDARRLESHMKLDAEMADAIDLCGLSHEARADSNLIPPVITTNRGQANNFGLKYHPAHEGERGTYPYHLPLELLILCRKGSDRLGQVRTVAKDGSTVLRPLLDSDRRDLFGTLLKEFPQGPERRTSAQDGKFLFVVDIEGNVLVAPIMQGNPPEEVKHGDLTPGRTPISRPGPQPHAWGDDIVGDHASGDYRGKARFGGEFDMLDEGEKHWIIHQKSGYALGRVSPEAIFNFEKMHPELEENEVWDNLPGSCFKVQMLGLKAVDQFRCYLHTALSVPTIVRDSYTCTFKTNASNSDVQGNLPVLDNCAHTDIPLQCGGGGDEATAAHVSLVEWMPPPELVECKHTGYEMTSTLERLDSLFTAYNNLRGDKQGIDVDSESEKAIAKEAKKLISFLKKTPCWQSAEFATTVKPGCPLSPCLDTIGMDSFTFALSKQYARAPGDKTRLALKMQAAEKWFHCPGSGENCRGILPFWNAHCRPLPREEFCMGLKPKYDERCSEHGADMEACREDKKKCYWPPDETEAVGYCAAHKYKDDDDCADYRIQRGCNKDDDCFWVAGHSYQLLGTCKGHKFSDDKKCAKIRSDIGCDKKKDCFFLRKEAARQNDRKCMPRPSGKKGKKCKDYRKQKCLEESLNCNWLD